jgi:hypothetical protein
LSTGATVHSSNYNFKRRWLKTDKWPTVEENGVTKPWAPGIPQDRFPDDWTEDAAYFGKYDYLAILGNDVTLQPNLFCKGPGYVATHNENELRRLLRKRKTLGYRMHAEDLHTINKRIKYLMKLENRVKPNRG